MPPHRNPPKSNPPSSNKPNGNKPNGNKPNRSEHKRSEHKRNPSNRSHQPRRRRSRRVYLLRRIAAAVVAVALVLAVALGVDKVVRAVEPGHTARAASQTTARTSRGAAPARRTTPAPARAGSSTNGAGSSTNGAGSSTNGAGSSTNGAGSTGAGTTGAGATGGGIKGGAAPAVAATASPGRTTVVLSAVGDLELGTTGELPPHPAQYLDSVEAALAAPIVFGNLEGTLSTDTTSKCPAGSTDCFAFQDPPAYATYLYAAGFDVLNSANNHSDDYGPVGVAQTSAALEAAGIVQAGLPNQIGLTSDGGTEVAFVDFAPYDTTNNLLDLSAAKALIQRARTLAPVVIVYMHAGAEGATADHVTGDDESYLGEDRGNPEAFAKAAIDDGASAVIASGPHVLRGMEFYRGHLIAYSLGDFAGYKNFATTGDLDLSGILHLELAPNGTFVQASWTSLLLSAVGRPAVDPSAASAEFVNGLSKADFGSSAALITADGSILPAAAAGAAALTATTSTTTAG